MESEAAQVKWLFSPDQSSSDLHLLLLKNENAEVVVRRLLIGNPNYLYLLKFFSSSVIQLIWCLSEMICSA